MRYVIIFCVLCMACSSLNAQRTVRITNQSVANGTGHSISAVIKTGTGTVLHNRQFVFNPLGSPVDFTVPATGTIVVNFGLQGDATLVEGSAVTHQALNGWTGAGTYVRFRAEFLQLGQQTVSISFNGDPSSIEKGRTMTGQATGAQGGNPYNFSSVSGGVSIAGNSTTGAFSITANTEGPFQIKVWASEGNGFQRSNDATRSGSVVDELKHKVRVSFDNRQSSTARTFKVWQNGALIASRTIAPGQLQVETIEVPTADPVTVTVSGQEILIDGVVWAPGEEVHVDTEVIVIQPEEVPNAADPVTTDKVTPPTPPKPPSDSSVWRSVDTTNKDEAVTAIQSAEGVEKIVSAVNKVTDEAKKINDREDARDEASSDIRERASTFSPQNFVNDIAASSAPVLDGIANTGLQDFNDSLPELEESGALPGIGGSSPEFTLGTISSGLPGGTWELQPFVMFPWLEGMLSIIREIFLWGMAYMFYRWAQGKLEAIQFALSLVPQLDTVDEAAITIFGNTVPGTNTAISLLKRVVVGGVVIGTIHIQCALAIALLNTKMGGIADSLWSVTNISGISDRIRDSATGTGASYIAKAFYMIDLVFPIAAALQFTLAYIVFSWACMAIFAFASAVIKATKI